MEIINPGYFDILGMFTFGVLLYVGISIRKKEKTFSLALIIIGVLGLIIDGYCILYNFILK